MSDPHDSDAVICIQTTYQVVGAPEGIIGGRGLYMSAYRNSGRDGSAQGTSYELRHIEPTGRRERSSLGLSRAHA